jgi:hypothetical protein
MKPQAEFYALCTTPMLPELQLWRAVLSRAVFDVQQGSLAQAKDVLKWIDTEDFERVVVWAGFELEQARIAAEELQRTFALRFEAPDGVVRDPIAPVTEPRANPEIPDAPPTEVHPMQQALLALIFTARDIRRAKKSSHSRRSRRRLPSGSASFPDAPPMTMGGAA